MTDEGLDYQSMILEAMRGVIPLALAEVAEHGLPEPNHIYITFRTGHPDVSIPPFLRDQHPEDMTIILEHQFWDLEVDHEAFSVSLRFGGQPHRLYIPYQAITAFIDPGAQFGLQFDALEAEIQQRKQERGEGSGEAGEDEEPAAGDKAPASPAADNVVRLDRFRKK